MVPGVAPTPCAPPLGLELWRLIEHSHLAEGICVSVACGTLSLLRPRKVPHLAEGICVSVSRGSHKRRPRAMVGGTAMGGNTRGGILHNT